MRLPTRLSSALIALAGKPCARLLSTAAAGEPLQFCIVGSGPAGFYTADKVRRQLGCPWML